MRTSMMQLTVFLATVIRFTTIRLAAATVHKHGLQRLPSNGRIDALRTQDVGGGPDSEPDQASGLSGNGTFDQYIDHNNPEMGKFRQHYYYNGEFWKAGSPVVLFTPGEESIDEFSGYTTNQTISGLIAQAVGGAVLVVEHRYVGESSPFEIHTAEHLQYLTIDQVVADFVRITKELKLPFDPAGSSLSPNAPWIWVGGSYSGRLGVWVEKLAPGAFWATYSSGAGVEIIHDFWQYYVPIQNGMPRNCSCDFITIVEYIDNIMEYGDSKQQAELKAMFGLQGVEDARDFVWAVNNPLTLWQNIAPTDGYSYFYQMCDAIEGFGQNTSVVSTTSPPRDGIGIEKALPNYAKWYTEVYLPGSCSGTPYPEWSDPNTVACLNLLNASNPFHTDWSSKNTDRTYDWLRCNEPIGSWNSGAPRDRPSLLSRLITGEYAEAQCALSFPAEKGFIYGAAAGRTAETYNTKHGGWNFTGKQRMFHVNGDLDPWREASVASDFRPGGPFQGTKGTPSFVIKGVTHCVDEIVEWGEVNSEVGAVQKAAVAQFSQWVKEFYATKGQRA